MQLHFIIYQTQNSEMPVQKPGLNLAQVTDGHFSQSNWYLLFDRICRNSSHFEIGWL